MWEDSPQPMIDAMVKALGERLPQGSERYGVEAVGLSARDRLHHYTTPAGLVGILAPTTGHQRHLRATHLLHSNDTAEFLLARQLVDEWFDERGVARPRFPNEEPDDYGSRPLSSPYVACFSTRRDDLSQWRAYGAPCGASIGFDAQELLNHQALRLIKCEYDRTIQRQVVADVLDALLNCDEAATFAEVNRLTPSGTMALLVMLGRIAPHFKHHTFAQEHEYRIQVPRDNDFQIQHQSYQRGVRSYLEVPLADDAIKEVNLGPGFADRDSVELLLSSGGLRHVPVEATETTFRGAL